MWWIQSLSFNHRENLSDIKYTFSQKIVQFFRRNVLSLLYYFPTRVVNFMWNKISSLWCNVCHKFNIFVCQLHVQIGLIFDRYEEKLNLLHNLHCRSLALNSPKSFNFVHILYYYLWKGLSVYFTNWSFCGEAVCFLWGRSRILYYLPKPRVSKSETTEICMKKMTVFICISQQWLYS